MRSQTVKLQHIFCWGKITKNKHSTLETVHELPHPAIFYAKRGENEQFIDVCKE